MNRTKKLIKKYYEMNAEDWQKRLETMHSNAGWNATNHTGEDLKNAFIRSYNQENAVIDYLNRNMASGTAKQADDYREWIYDGASNEPDINIYNTDICPGYNEIIAKVEVKNKNFFTFADKCWKMHFYANIYQRDKQQIIDYI